jgi:hypothetical protein
MSGACGRPEKSLYNALEAAAKNNQPASFWGTFMLDKYPVITKLVCVALVVSFVFPAGQMLFPMIGDEIGATPYGAIEAVLSTSLGFGLYSVLFG